MRRLCVLVQVMTLCVAGTMAAQIKENRMLSVEDKAGVESVALALNDAWNRHDMAAYGAQLTEDCEWVNVVGMNWVGKASVMKALRAFHATMFKETDIEIEERRVTAMAPGVALVTSTERMGAYTTPSGQVMKGVEDRMTLVMVKQSDGRWLIRSGHNTTIDRGAERFDPGK